MRAWLSEYQIRNLTYSSTRDWIHICVPIQLAEDLLDTKYYIFHHAADGLTAIRSSGWSLPLHLHDHIDAIHPTNVFLNTKRKSRHLERRSEVLPLGPLGLGENGAPTYDELVAIDRTEFGHMVIPYIEDLPEDASASQACNRVATSPTCLRVLYGLRGYEPLGLTRIGVVNFLDHVSNQTDIETFLQRFRLDAVGAGSEIQTEIVPSSNQDSPQRSQSVSLEANLDIETVLGLTHPVPVTAYNVGGRAPFLSSQFSAENTNEPYLEWLQFMLAQPDLPQVITISYADEEQTVPLWYAKR